MPLRDHFRPPVSDRHSWDELHGGWPMVIVQHLYGRLPPNFTAVPNVRVREPLLVDESPRPSGGGGAAPAPTFTVEVGFAEPDEYEVRIYNTEYGRVLVAAIELVGPASKDRPEHRRAFAVKAAALVQQGVAVSIVDLVTVRRFNLYADLLDLVGHADPALGADPPHLYVATLRTRTPARGRAKLDTWFTPLELGRPLPMLPLWLAADRVVRLDLDPTYEDACRVLHIG